jgi:transcriptional regulator GlxA family with amidase domain
MTQHLGFLVLPGFPMACLTSAIEPLRAANEIAGRQAFRWSVVGETPGRVASSAAVVFEPDTGLDGLTRPDYLFVLSGPDGAFRNPGHANARLRRMARTGVPIGAVSGAIFPVARAGLLDGYRVAVHWLYDSAFRAEFPEIDASSAVIEIDRTRLTVAGAASAFDLMLGLVEHALGPEVMTEVACWFQHPVIRGEGVAQKTPGYRADRTQDSMPATVARAIRILDSHLDEPIRIAEVASRLRISARQLDRSFHRFTGRGPLAYYRMLRMKRARQLVLYTQDTLTSVALAVGYGSTTPLVRYYLQEFGVTPQQDRAAQAGLRARASALPSGDGLGGLDQGMV